MENGILKLFNDHPDLALLISLAVSILIAIAGILPSVFVTAANIIFFGFVNGTFISFLGESIGALVAFLLYRKGFKKASQHGLQQHPRLQRLVAAEGKEAFSLIFLLRLIPFVPSGLITFAAAIGKPSLLVFVIASSLGKIPALLMEAYSVYEVKEFGWQGKLILVIVPVILLYLLIRKRNLKT